MPDKSSLKFICKGLIGFTTMLLLITGGIISAQTELPQDPYQRGLVLLNQFKYAEAKASFDQALAKYPNHKNAFYYRGKCLVELNQQEAAMNDFNKSLNIDSNFALGYVGLAEVYTKNKDYSRAMELVDKALVLDPKKAEALYQKGVIYGYQNKVSEAITYFNSCLEVKPTHAYAHYQLGLAYYQKQRPDLAIVHFEKFLQLAPEAPEAPQVRNLLNFLRR